MYQKILVYVQFYHGFLFSRCVWNNKILYGRIHFIFTFLALETNCVRKLDFYFFCLARSYPLHLGIYQLLINLTQFTEIVLDIQYMYIIYRVRCSSLNGKLNTQAAVRRRKPR